MEIKHKHLFWIMELVIWLLVLFGIANGIMLFRYNYKKNLNTYQIFIPDVDGLIVGSPVRLMGIHVGYVSQLNIVGEDVYVKFVITSKGAKIPPKSKATVEFSGLGGSKSLEIYPPTSTDPPTDKFIIAQSPKRIHDSLSLLSKMFDKLMTITDDVSNFVDNVDNLHVEQKPTHPSNPEEAITKSDKWLDGAQDGANHLNKSIEKTNKKITKFNNEVKLNGNRNGNENADNK
jgi:hypothetical protein